MAIELDRYDEAIEYFERALATSPLLIDSIRGKSFALRSLGRVREASMFLGGVRPGRPEAGIEGERGLAAAAEFSYGLARRHLGRALALDDAHPDAEAWRRMHRLAGRQSLWFPPVVSWRERFEQRTEEWYAHQRQFGRRLARDHLGLGVGEQAAGQSQLLGVAAAGRRQVGEPVDDGDVLDLGGGRQLPARPKPARQLLAGAALGGAECVGSAIGG